MANTSQKKIAHDNAKTLLNLRKGFIWVNAFYIFYRVMYHWGSFGWKQIIGYLLTAGLTVLLYLQIEVLGSPRYNNKRELISSGEDLSQEGLVQYAFDIIYVTWFVHVTSAFWTKMWWFMLSIPAYGGYKAYYLAMPLLARQRAMAAGGAQGGAAGAQGGAPNYVAPGSVAEGTKSKRREKMEKRAEKGHAQVRYR